MQTHDESEGEPASGESANYLLAVAFAHDFRISKRQLARWHCAGLLPRPKQRTLGPGRGRGTESIYPPGTTKLLLAFCEIRKRERRLSYIAWYLWWSGYEHDALTKQIRESLQQLTAEWERNLKQWVQDGRVTEAGYPLLDQAEEPRIHYKLMRRIRRRVGYARMSTFMRVAIGVVSGTFGDWRNGDDPNIVARGLGIPKAPSLRELSQQVPPRAMREAVARATDEDLIRARNEIRALLSSPTIIASLGLGEVAEDLVEGPWGQMAGLLVWLVFRSKLPSALPPAKYRSAAAARAGIRPSKSRFQIIQERAR